MLPEEAAPALKQCYENSVFINCPYDELYQDLFRAMIFAIQDLGFFPRCALERRGTENRLDKIIEIIDACQFGIHDISRTALNNHGLPRFNMPFEFGLDYACSRFGNDTHKRKKFLVLDQEPYRYHQFFSDVSGMDIQSHENSPERVIQLVRAWLVYEEGARRSGDILLFKRYSKFKENLPKLCEELETTYENLSFADYSHMVTAWINKENGF